jgi:hypothetical protein
MDVKNISEFVKISKSELKETDLETLELVDFGKIRNESAPYGDFLVLQAPGYAAKKIILKKLNQEFLNLNSFWTIQKMQM